jgi:mRNA interferase RelE/StbE
MYRVRIERKAQKKLSKIPEPYYSNLKIAILELGNNPRPPGCKKLKGRDA